MRMEKKTTDPAVLFPTEGETIGAMLPFGDHKGSGLALMCEILAGVFTGGGTIQPGNPRENTIINCMLSIIIDPLRVVTDQEWLKNELDSIINYVKSCPSADPEASVLVAGEPERQREQERSKGVKIDKNTWKEILESAGKCGVSSDLLLSSLEGNDSSSSSSSSSSS